MVGLIKSNINDVEITPLKIIDRELGNIMHALKSNEKQFKSYGEAYFTFVNKGMIKGWKQHKKMYLNLIVPLGEVKFVLIDNRITSSTFKNTFEIKLSRTCYQRLSVPPGILMAFQGFQDENMILNIASIPHDPNDTIEKKIEEINYEW